MEITKSGVFFIAGIILATLAFTVPVVTPPGQTVVLTSFPNVTLCNIMPTQPLYRLFCNFTIPTPPWLRGTIHYLNNYFGGWHIYFMLTVDAFAVLFLSYSIMQTIDEETQNHPNQN